MFCTKSLSCSCFGKSGVGLTTNVIIWVGKVKFSFWGGPTDWAYLIGSYSTSYTLHRISGIFPFLGLEGHYQKIAKKGESCFFCQILYVFFFVFYIFCSFPPMSAGFENQFFWKMGIILMQSIEVVIFRLKLVVL